MDRIVLLRLSPQSEEQVLAELHHLFRQNPTLQRPGRQYVHPPSEVFGTEIDI